MKVTLYADADSDTATPNPVTTEDGTVDVFLDASLSFVDLFVVPIEARGGAAVVVPDR